MKITGPDVFDLGFPTSEALDGPDAMNPDPDYSASYVIVRTDAGFDGHGLSFTIGRGNEIVCHAIRSLAARVEQLDVSWIAENSGRFSIEMRPESIENYSVSTQLSGAAA